MSASQGDSAQALLAALTDQLNMITLQQPTVNAVTIKLPEFWSSSPEVWFARVEAQFGTKIITQDQTKYVYVVSALDFKTAEEVHDVLLNPPEVNKYENLKKALIKAFGKSQAQRANELLNLNGLGDRKPTALLRRINALNDDPQTLKRTLFLSNLPADVRSIVIGQDFDDLDKVAEAADRAWESRCVSSGIQHIAASDHPSPRAESVSKFKSHNARHQGSGNTPTAPVCFYHLKFGPHARKCQPGCKFASLVSKYSGNDKASH